jgi:hypothetical protein
MPVAMSCVLGGLPLSPAEVPALEPLLLALPPNPDP